MARRNNTPQNVGIGIAAPTRFVTPTGNGNALLEWTHSPLYSSAFLAAAGAAIARETELFGYVPGGTIPGSAQIATRFHTNMASPRQLQRPDVFLVQGIRIAVPGLDYQTAATPAIDDDTTGGAAANMDQVDDLTTILHATALTFFVGQKTYAEGPAWMFPFNCGAGGTIDTSAGGAGPGWQTRNALFGQGRAFRFDRLGNPVMLWDGQTFGARLTCNWGGGNPTLVDGKLVFVYLDGAHGRAVQ
jgi:hypothetical protein